MTGEELINFFEGLKLPDWVVKQVYKAGGQGSTLVVFNDATKEYGVFKAPHKVDGNNLGRFVREMEILAEVGKTNVGIAPLLEHSLVGQDPWFITKKGDDFRDYWGRYLASNGNDYRNIFDTALTFIQHLLVGLSDLHLRHDPIVHRDIKPVNIILLEGKPNLIDFGVAFWSGKERITDVDDAVGNKRFSPDIMMYRVDEVIPWLDVFMMSQLMMWMLAEKPSKNWDRPVDFRFVKYPPEAGEEISKIRAFTGACSEEVIGPKNAGEMLSLMNNLFYKPKLMDKTDLSKVVSAFNRVGEAEADFSAEQLSERVAGTKRIEAIRMLVDLKIKEVNGSVDNFVRSLCATGVSAEVVRRNDNGLDRLIALINERTPQSGFDAVEMISIKVMSPAKREIHLGVTIDINVIRAKSVENPFYFRIVRLMQYEKFIYMDKQGTLYDSPDLRRKIEVEIVDLIRMWFEDPRNWF